MRYRSGIGYDVHQFAEGRPLVLGGITIAHDRGLAGHSDADVLSHAIADAPRLGLKTFFGVILDTNNRSIALLRKFGFQIWGRMPDVADFNGEECGHVYMGRRLS